MENIIPAEQPDMFPSAPSREESKRPSARIVPLFEGTGDDFDCPECHNTDRFCTRCYGRNVPNK
jgi:hypothetical protein